MKLLLQIVLLELSLLFVQSAVGANLPGIGGMAQNMMDPVGFLSDFIYSGCILIGGSFLFASIIKYVEHRRSPLMVPISTVVFLFIAGALLIALPFLPYIDKDSVAFSFFG
jgi:hypothetical protein